MNKSYYFAELAASYDAEIQDLLTDSEGKAALKARLKEKRQELDAILPMIEFAPEMVVPVFYDGFAFPNPKALATIVQREPDDGDFPDWENFSALVTLQDWAKPYVDRVLAESAGEAFMVAAACLEYIRLFDTSAPATTDEDSDKEDREDGDDDEDDRDLAEAGDDWLGQQGFDSLKS
jgi:hypothetical protein